MGYYIPSSVRGKAQALVNTVGACIIPEPSSFESIPTNLALICVVDNRAFEAAAYCYSPLEFKAFSDPSDGRPKIWLTMDKALAEELSGFNA